MSAPGPDRVPPRPPLEGEIKKVSVGQMHIALDIEVEVNHKKVIVTETVSMNAFQNDCEEVATAIERAVHRAYVQEHAEKLVGFKKKHGPGPGYGS